MSQVLLEDYHKVLRSSCDVLRLGGELIFDLGLKSPFDWISTEDEPLELVADVMHKLFRVPFPTERVAQWRDTSRVYNAVGHALVSAGFSNAEVVHFQQEIGIEAGRSLVRMTIKDLLNRLSGVIRLHTLDRTAYINAQQQISASIDMVYGVLEEKLQSLFGHRDICLGLAVFKAVK